MRYFWQDYGELIIWAVVLLVIVAWAWWAFDNTTKDATDRGGFYTRVIEIEGQPFVIFWNDKGLSSQPLATNAEEGGSDVR